MFDSALMEDISVPEVEDIFSDGLESKLTSWLSWMLDFMLTSGLDEDIAFFWETAPSLITAAASKLTI